MQFVVLATDKPDGLDLRQQIRQQHRRYLRQSGPRPARVLLAGPTLAADGERMNGTLLVVEADSINAVACFIADDPYSKAGLFEQVEIRPWNCGLGQIADAAHDPKVDPA